MNALRMLPFVLVVLLAGCWESQELLLDPAKATRPIPIGTYRDADGKQVKVSLEPDGIWFRVDGRRVLFNYYGVPGNGMEGYAYAAETGEAYAYGLIYVAKDGTVYESRPNCEIDHFRDSARNKGARVRETSDGWRCEFTGSADLDWALKQQWQQGTVSIGLEYKPE